MDFSRFEQIAECFFKFFTGDYFVHAFEVIVAFVLFYYVIRVLVDNNAKKFIGIYSGLIICACVLALLAAGISLNLYLIFILLLSMFFLLMFNIEIKRSIWNVKKAEIKNNFAAEHKTTAETEACISAIIKALQNMSKRDTGALVVLSDNNIPKQVTDSGVLLNADISYQLIEGVFVNKAPLHDGAMIISGHKIKAAGCFLPMSQNINLPSDLGSRHRAAVGITEVTDVIAIVVSEETGIISVARRGSIDRYADYSMLRNILTSYYWNDSRQKNKRHKANTEE